MATKSDRVILPVRVQHAGSGKLEIKSTGADAGWSTIACENVAHAREIMARYPAAAMPCWKNPRAIWNRE